MPGLLDRVQTNKTPATPPKAPTPSAASQSPTPAATQNSTHAQTTSEELASSSSPSLTPEMFAKLRHWITERLTAEFSNAEGIARDDQSLKQIRDRMATIYATANVNLGPEQRKQLEDAVMNELIGFGPIQPYLEDNAITEIMVNGPNHIYIEKAGHITETGMRFDDDAHVNRIIDRILIPLGRRVDRKWPMADGRLPDGSRVNVIVPPSAIDGSTITIRKFSKKKLMIEDLIQFGTLTPQMGEFLKACVVSRLNIIVSGGTGSGKTTLLNVLSNFIPDHERIVTIEDSAELHLNKPHVVRLEARPADADGTGRVSIRDLVVNSLRMRPERIIVGECRGGEALDMLQAMNTGHDGSLTTIHANTPRDTISRLETLALMAGIDFPIRVIREQIAAAIDLIVAQARLRDGSRKIVQISEVQGMEGEIVVMQDVFKFIDLGSDSNGQVIGEMRGTGIRPKFTPRLQVAGFNLPPEIFGNPR